MIDVKALKLGRLAPTPHQRAMAPRLDRFLTKRLPMSPVSVHSAQGAPIAMFGNSRYGDCTFAALADLIAIWSKALGTPFEVTEDLVVNAYLKFTGNRDEGANEVEVLSTARDHGFNFGGSAPWQLATWARVPLQDEEMCRACIAIFHALYIGVELPLAAQNQSIWLTPQNQQGVNKPNSWGAHALLWSGYDKVTEIDDLCTWGMVQPAERGWGRAYTDEAYVLVPMELAETVGVDWEELSSYVATVRTEGGGP